MCDYDVSVTTEHPPDFQDMNTCLTATEHPLPFGAYDLDPHVTYWGRFPRRVRCYVRGCRQILEAPTRSSKGDVCPEHGIRCHCSSFGTTYSYPDVRRNAIVGPDLLATRVVGHPFKFESHRLGLERSEDMLSWNVFRSLQVAGCLGTIARLITGDTTPQEPLLFLWGICLTDDAFSPSDLLIAARHRFESNLPVERPLTEPDIMLWLPSRYLVLIEAKFTSPNTIYERGPRKDAQSLTLEELLSIYHDPSLCMLDHTRSLSATRIYYQLWRNMVFAEWMARADSPTTKAYHVNLVREGYETASAAEFHGLVRPAFGDRFRQITWERIHQLCTPDDRLSRLCRYLETKTAGLVRAFNLT